MNAPETPILAVLQMLCGGLLLLVSPMAAENGYPLMVWMATVAVLLLWGGTRLWTGTRWGVQLCAAGNLLFGVPALALNAMIVMDLVDHKTSWDSAGYPWALLTVLIPVAFLAVLWRHRKGAVSTQA